jgi:hypothetical protein
MSGTNYLDNNNQTSLLFKRFQNKVQAGINTGSGSTDYSNETTKALKNVFNSSIFAEDVPLELPNDYWINELDICGNITESVWDNSTNQTIGSFQIPNTPLTFYKDIFLKPCQGTNNAWYLLSGGLSTDNNVIKNMIPYNYQPVNDSTYTPIVKYWNGSSWQSQGQNNYNPTGLNWIIDYESGVLEFYQTDTILNNSFNIDYSSPPDSSQNRPRISCICYTGQMGITGSGSGGSGKITVGDISNGIIQNQLDVSAIYFDEEGFDVSLNVTDKTAIITNKGGSGSGGGGITDLSYNLFNIPLAPTDGSGYLNENLGTGTIVLKWTNPVNYQAALPFGKYTTYPNGTSDISLVDIDRLPFHRHLNIEYLQYSGGIPDNSANLNSSWVDLSINNPKQTVLPNTLTEAYLISNDGSSTVDLCGNPNDVNNAPYERVSFSLLELGKGYQFRIYLDNRGTTDPNGYPVTDPLYGQDVSWNYLYIPDSSNDYIELGSFGPAIAPDDAEITNSSYKEFDVKLSTTNNADASLNTPFPINLNLNLEYAFGIGISGEVDTSSNQQMPNARYDTLYPGNYPFNISDISSGFQRQNSDTLEYAVLESDLSACPQFKYTLNNLYGVNSAFPNDLSYNYDISYTKILPKPTRTEAILSSNSEWQNTLTSNSEVNNDAIVIDNSSGYVYDLSANPAVSNALIANTLSVTFLENSSNYDGEVLPNSPNGDKFVANNFSNNRIGIDSSGYQCSYLHASVFNSSVQDASGNATTGYLDVSYSDLSNSDFLIQSKVVEAGKTPKFQNHGYYTGLNITNLTINNINLSKYPDISNNTNYDPYEFRIQHYYNNPATVGSINWDTSGNYKFKKFYIGKRPDGPIQYTLNGYNNPSPSPNNYLMGLRRPNPSSPILIDYSYNLFDINPTWASPTITLVGGLSKSTLYYEPSSLSTGQSVGSSYISTYPGDGITTSKDIIPGLQISSGFYTTTQKYSRTYSTGPQFAIQGKHINNVSYLPDPSTIPQQDISFGVLNERLWWDYTWGGTGSQPTDLPSGFFSTEPSSPIVFIKANGYNGWDASLNYNHEISITDKQLMWANSNFVGVADAPSSANYPYIDFSSNYYNPNGELLNYSDFSLNGLSGESFSQTYTSTPAQNNFWNQNQGSNTTVNRVLKYITFNIECPFRDAFQGYISGTSQDFIYQLTLTDSQGNNIDHDTSVTSNSDGYWVFHNEKNTTGFTFGPFDGQKLWTTATGTSAGSGSYVQNTGTVNDGYKIAFPSQTTGIKSILQISIGLPSDLEKSIKTVDIIFKAV